MQTNHTTKRIYRHEDLSGKIFGRLTVESFSHRLNIGNSYRTFWNCVCICGTTRVVRSDTIKEGAPCAVCRSREIADNIRTRTTKRCSVCKRVLDKSEFNVDNQSCDKVHTRCKPCVTEMQTAQRCRQIERASERETRKREHKYIEPPLYKTCTDCGEVKPINAFFKRKLTEDGFNTWCKECEKHKVRHTKFKITRQQYQEMFAACGGRCPICKRSLVGHRAVATDHCHQTGRVRGLLCPKCNLGIGFFKDSPRSLRNAALYLEQTKQS